MIKTIPLRPLIPGTAVMAGVAAVGVDAAVDPALAQTVDAGGAPQAVAPDLALPTISVTATGESLNPNAGGTGISRLPETVFETPQTVNVVPQEIIRQQGATTLEDVLRNVPGITLSTGEGNGGQNGDQFRIRGMTARGDMFIDGLRDFGTYTRDAFATESVEVIKGPSGEAFGVGTAGGLINRTTKRAFLGEATAVEGSWGTGPLYRGTVDSNFQINDTTALRTNVMIHDEDVADRKHAENDRIGAAFALGLGLGTSTEWHLGYMYQHGDRKPDYGVPMLAPPDGGTVQPITEFGRAGIPRDTSYIRSTDRDETDVHVLSSLFERKLDNGLVINNDTRLSFYERDFSSTNPSTCADDPEDLDTCASTILSGGNYPLSYGAGGGMTYKQDGWGVQNVTTGRMELRTGSVRHRALAGLDLSYQHDERDSGQWVGRDSDQMIRNPRYDYSGAVLSYPPEGHREADATNVGIFVSDRMWFTEAFSLQAGLRWDYFESEFDSSDPDVQANGFTGKQDSSEWSPSLSLIWEPNAATFVYASFARSYKPIGTDISAMVTNGTSETPRDGWDFKPEQTDLYEIGARANLLDGRLGLFGSIFQIEKENSTTTDPVTGDVVYGFSESGQSRRVRGIELGAGGAITRAWNVTASYAYLDGEITAAAPPQPGNDSVVGNVAPNTPKNNFNLWTTYDLSSRIPGLGGELLIGGGLQYSSSYWADAANTAKVPETLTVDALISYETDRFRVALNGMNLTDELYYASAFNASRAVPASGRTVMLTVGVPF